jgi:amidase
VSVNYEQALDRARRRPEAGALWGVPYAIKDLNDYPGLPFTRGSALFKDSMGQGRTPYTQKIDEAGLITLGKTNTPEFGLLPTTEPAALGPCRNPWNRGHSPGGSSGGAAAAVAARLVPAAQASDGGGSIRNPSCLCGVLGLKPSRGRFPDQATPNRGWDISIRHAVSLSVRDNALILALTEQGKGGPLQPVGYVERSDVPKMRIAMSLKDGRGDAPHPTVAKAVREAATLLEELGHKLVPTEDSPHQQPNFYDHFVILWAVGADGMVRLAEQMTGKHPADTGVLEPWTLSLSEYYRKQPPDVMETVIATMKATQDRVAQWFATYDAWLTPTASLPAPKLGEVGPSVPFDTLVDRCMRLVGHMPIHNVAGTPGISIPFDWTENDLPIGVQLSSGVGKEATLLGLAYQIEEARPWIGRRPKLVA